MSARILAFGDLHLGAGQDRLDDQAAVLDRIVELALERDVDAVCFAGDATHHRSAIQEVAIFQGALARLNKARVPILLIPGNHDVSSMGVDSTVEVAARGFEWASVARTPGLIGHALDVAVFGLPWCPTSAIAALDPTGQVDDVARTATEILMDVARGMRASHSGPAVLLLHWSMSGAVTPTGALVDEFREVVLPSRELAEMGWDVVIGAHIHTTGFLVEDPHPVIYTGSAAAVDFGEEHTKHGAWIIDFEAGSLAAIEFVEIPDRKFVTVAYAPEYGVLQEMGVDLNGAIVRVRYSATVGQERLVDHEDIKRELYGLGVHRVHSIQPTIIRAESARTAVTEDVSIDNALAQWLADIPGLQGSEFERVMAVHAEIKEAVR